MSTNQIVKSVCGLCGGGCGMLITLKDGQPVDVSGDPDGPSNRGGLCRVGQASLEYLTSPARLTTPLKRTGKRGENQWEKISWDEAFRFAADGLTRAKAEHGAESVTIIHGAAKPFIDTLAVRFANAFGTPNVVCADHVCAVPRLLGMELTFGFSPSPEFGHPPGCAMVWGTNRAETGIFRNREILQARSKGSKIIVIDPLRTPYVDSANLWLQPKPGTDLALALGLLNVVVTENLYDADFVKKWTVGFDTLKTHLMDFSPRKVADLTWVPEDLIIEAARLYATSGPSCMALGNALDGTPDSFQTCRAIAMLMAITGNLDVPGGEAQNAGTGFRWCDTEAHKGRIHGRWSEQMELRQRLAPQQKQKLAPHLLPDFRYNTPSTFVRSVLDGEPYRTCAAFVQASNPLSSWSNIMKVRDAFNNLDFLVVSDLFMTPTAAMADVLFPVATFLEFDGVRMGAGGGVAQCQRKVAQLGECRSDVEIVNGLARALGLQEFFWDDLDSFWDYVLKPAGITFRQLQEMGSFRETRSNKYRKYEDQGFMTPTGKVELYSEQLANLGFDPMPTYREPSLSSDIRTLTEEYDLMCTCHKVMPYQHSGGRQIERLRETHPDPIVIIHPDTGHEKGIAEGDWVFIESKTGKVRQKARLSTAVAPRVVVAEHGWWYPEQGHETLYGFAESNYNALTDDGPPFSPEVGSFTVRGIACKVYRAE